MPATITLGRGRLGVQLVAPVLAAILWVGCAPSSMPVRPGYNREIGMYPSSTQPRSTGYTETGMISYYSEKFHGRKTASGDKFNKNGFTAAHRTLPFHSKIKVTNLSNGKSVVVEVNDRGPFSSKRILDLSPAAARRIGLLESGTVKATVTVE